MRTQILLTLMTLLIAISCGGEKSEVSNNPDASGLDQSTDPDVSENDTAEPDVQESDQGVWPEDTTPMDLFLEDNEPMPDTIEPQTAPYIAHEWGVLFNQRMQATPSVYTTMDDKPVIYFYTDEEVNIEAGVQIVGGTGRETWPETELGEFLYWSDVTIEPDPCGDTATPFPAFGEGQCEFPWDMSCEASSLGEVVVDEASCIQVDQVRSPLLFYAGITDEPVLPLTGDYALHPVEPAEVSVTFMPEANFTGKLLVVYRDISTDWDEVGSFHTTQAKYDYVALDMDDEWEDGPLSVTLHPKRVVDIEAEPEIEFGPIYDEITGEFEDALVTQGLTEAEADTFMRAWAQIFFGTNAFDGHPNVPGGVSVAVIGIHKQHDFDTWLPLTLTPAPEELVRVLVSLTYL